MSMPKRKRRPPFIALPRHKRSDAVIKLKGRIRRAAAEYGGRFLSDVAVNEVASTEQPSQWLDFYFVGADRFTFWNAEIITAKLAFDDAFISGDALPVIHESFEIDRSYVHGIGLYIVVDVPAIDRSVVDAAIDRFKALGEVDWVAAHPVPRDRLM